MFIRNIVVVTALNLIVLTQGKYVPPVTETVDEQSPIQYVRTIRQIPKSQLTNQKQQIWNFQSIPQPDRLKSQYYGQQQADFRNVKFNQKPDSEWKPFQPKYVPFKPNKPFDRKKKTVKTIQDSHAANSETVEQKVTAEPHQGQNTQYVYVQQQEEGPSGIQELQKILVGAPANIQIEHNGSPADPQQFEALQKHLEAVNQAKAEEVLAEAQKQAQAHLQAQHEAIANAQKQAQEAAYAKIAAHNQGLTTLTHPESEQHQEVSALQARPLEQVLANPLKHQYGGAYSSSEQDLRNAKPVVPQIQYLAAAPPLYNTKEVPQINYSPVSPYTPHLVQEVVVTTPKSVVLLPQPQAFSPQPQIFSAHPQELVAANIAEHEDERQYAPKYAFGYRILDEQHGNDYGHEEERDGKLTKGKYFVKLPDGRKQSVEYYADHSGYHARVTYENTAVHPYGPVAHPNEAQQLYVNQVPTGVHE